MDMQSMSISSGERGGVRHNIDVEYRQGLTHIDQERTKLNEVLANNSIDDVYDNRFGEALSDYNETQREKGHPERAISSYIDKMRSSKQEKPSYELIVQIGRMDTNPATDEECREVSAAVYREFFDEFKRRYHHFDVVLSAIHQDEATPHMHIEYVPWCDGNKRGLETKNGHTRAIKQMGFNDVEDLNRDMFDVLEEIAERHGVKRVDMGLAGHEHRNVRQFKQIIADAENRGYAYNNDPRLVAVAAESTEQIAECARIIDEQREFIEEVSREKNPFKMKHLAQMAVRLVDGTRDRVERLRTMLAEWRATMVDIPSRWRESVLNPVGDRLRAARWDEAARVESEQAERLMREEMKRWEASTPRNMAEAARAAASSGSIEHSENGFRRRERL